MAACDVATEGKGGRTLREESSNPESPPKKVCKKDGGDGEDDDDKKMMMKNMMKMMKNMQGDMKEMKGELGSATAVAKEAKALAHKTQESLQRIEGEVVTLQETIIPTMITKDELPNLVRAIITEPQGNPRLHGMAECSRDVRGGKGGKPASQVATDTDKRSRTVYFGMFPDDTPGETIKQFIDEWTNEWKDDIEDSYPIGMIGEKGAARFNTEDKMWEFFKRNKGKLQFDALGKTVYASADSIHDSNPAKTKAVRKMIRTVIECNGRDGRKVKAQMKGTSYQTGRVYWKGERVGEWIEAASTFLLKGTGKEYEETFNKLMKQDQE